MLYNIDMERRLKIITMTKKQNREFLRIMKVSGFVKFNTYLQRHNISQPAFSRYLSDDSYDMISNDNLNIVSDEIYNSALFIIDMYNECKKIA